MEKEDLLIIFALGFGTNSPVWLLPNWLIARRSDDGCLSGVYKPILIPA
ncbi:MAG: hypothetical protein MJZ79_01505 [Paludibacteraceae bacterium]|nr:hypothetical protein [Paludibacteraceae bacterium]